MLYCLVHFYYTTANTTPQDTTSTTLCWEKMTCWARTRETHVCENTRCDYSRVRFFCHHYSYLSDYPRACVRLCVCVSCVGVRVNDCTMLCYTHLWVCVSCVGSDTRRLCKLVPIPGTWVTIAQIYTIMMVSYCCYMVIYMMIWGWWW